MKLTPYPSRIRICDAARAAGHVVGVDDDTVIIETGNITLRMDPGAPITDSDGKTYTPQEALDALGVAP